MTQDVAGVEPADRVAAVVRAVPGVAGLHPGMFGEVGTYLPGRRVPGVRITDTETDIHVTVYFDVPVRDVAAQIRSAVHGAVGGAVNVTVEDVIPRPSHPAATPDFHRRRVQ
ncbi:Asp23/Gls24 family envelope stress response protein [Mycolicibacterium mengxianglii]|uniref:Asp23/Gls24 family envelope stress response protein n=1 Tax=Mycolicibacterium mengxianglii TaxID=2736649 RepID=UPI0018D0808C|nr:Asp23/Gls24 family envelope stress response protein [Mycolicibacterium mengxianglii]